MVTTDRRDHLPPDVASLQEREETRQKFSRLVWTESGKLTGYGLWLKTLGEETKNLDETAMAEKVKPRIDQNRDVLMQIVFQQAPLHKELIHELTGKEPSSGTVIERLHALPLTDEKFQKALAERGCEYDAKIVRWAVNMVHPYSDEPHARVLRNPAVDATKADMFLFDRVAAEMLIVETRKNIPEWTYIQEMLEKHIQKKRISDFLKGSDNALSELPEDAMAIQVQNEAHAVAVCVACDAYTKRLLTYLFPQHTDLIHGEYAQQSYQVFKRLFDSGVLTRPLRSQRRYFRLNLS